MAEEVKLRVASGMKRSYSSAVVSQSCWLGIESLHGGCSDSRHPLGTITNTEDESLPKKKAKMMQIEPVSEKQHPSEHLPTSNTSMRKHMQCLEDDEDWEDSVGEQEDEEEIFSSSSREFPECEEYAEDIYTQYLHNEKHHRPKRLDYFTNLQTSITEAHRAILVDWLVQVTSELKFASDTLYLAINIINRYLALERVEKARFQLVGITSLLIAAKYEEKICPRTERFVEMCADTYSSKEILLMEAEILNKLNFEVTVSTEQVFLRYFLHLIEADPRLIHLASYLSELSLLDFGFVRFLPSIVAASAVFLALRSLGREPWPQEIEYHSGYSLEDDDMRECIHSLFQTFQTATYSPSDKAMTRENLQAIRKKYAQPRFLSVSREVSPPIVEGDEEELEGEDDSSEFPAEDFDEDSASDFT